MATPVASQGGFTYLGLLMAVVVMGLMLTIVGRVWSTTEQREREIQLLFAGHQIRNAIAGYFAQRHHYPQTLQDLLGDPDSSLPQRYLRRLYPDPMTGTPEWQQIMAPGGGVMGRFQRHGLLLLLAIRVRAPLHPPAGRNEDATLAREAVSPPWWGFWVEAPTVFATTPPQATPEVQFSAVMTTLSCK
jgi:hypothetical protein